MSFLTCVIFTSLFVITTDQVKPDPSHVNADTKVVGENQKELVAVKVIPISKVWAYGMSGTRDVRELERRRYEPKESLLTPKKTEVDNSNSLVSQILSVLPYLPVEKPERPRAGFAVHGKRRAVLHGAHGVLAARGTPFSRFANDSDINVVFFSHAAGVQTQLKRIELRNCNVKVFYKFVNRNIRIITNSFALIPLGKLPQGTYKVEMIQEPDKKAKNAYERLVHLDSEKVSRIVCDPFTFVVEEPIRKE